MHVYMCERMLLNLHLFSTIIFSLCSLVLQSTIILSLGKVTFYFLQLLVPISGNNVMESLVASNLIKLNIKMRIRKNVNRKHTKMRTKMASVGREMWNIKSIMTLLNPYLHSHLNPPHPTFSLRISDRRKQLPLELPAESDSPSRWFP